MYGKIFAGLFHGSMVGRRGAQHVFVYLISHADRDGHVDAHPVEVAALTGMTSDEVTEALDELASPDPHSRTTDDDGRRIERIGDSWTWWIINYGKYLSMQDRDSVRDGNRERKRKQRDSESRLVTDGHGSSRQGEGEGEGEGDKKPDASSPPLRGYEELSPGGADPDAPEAEKPTPMSGSIKGLADKKRLRTPKPDWRVRTWDHALAIGRTAKEANDLMAVAGLLSKRGCVDSGVHARAFRAIVQSMVKNPASYFAANGVALNALIGLEAEDRAGTEKAVHEAADRRAGLTRRR